MARLHLVIRLAILLVLGMIGSSSLYWLLYLALPAFAALLVAQRGSVRYLEEVAPVAVRVLKWFAGAYAYLWLLTDEAPTPEPGAHVELEVEPCGMPTPKLALQRLLTSVPAALFLLVLSIVAGLLWVLGAFAILLFGRVPQFVTGFIAMTLCYQFRLAAYHLSLVDQYPSLEQTGGSHFSGSGAA